jgi:hypothetical protein
LLEKLSKVLGLSALVLSVGCSEPTKVTTEQTDAGVVPSATASASPVVSAAPSATATASAKRAQVNGCLVKGNITEDGRRVYHVQGSCPDYASTKINKPGERCFGSEAEAKSAGWKKSSNCR